MMAAIMIVIAISPMLAPLTGSLVMAWGGWREIFAVLGVAAFISLGLILFVLPEALPEDQRQPVRFDVMLAAAKRLLGDRRFMGLTMIGGFGMASASSSFWPQPALSIPSNTGSARRASRLPSRSMPSASSPPRNSLPVWPSASGWSR